MQQDNPIQMIQDYRQFKQSLQENPEQKMKQLISSGQISQRELNNLQFNGRLFFTILKQFNLI